MVARVWAADGSVIFDSDRMVCLSLKSKGTATAGTPFGPRARLYDLAVAGETMPLVALRVTGASPGQRGGTILSVTKSGSSWVFKVLIFNTANTDWSFSYYVYGAPVHSGGAGCRAWDANGRLLFDWTQPILNFGGASGGTKAFLANSRMDYQENFAWDTIEQQEIIGYEYVCQIYWVSGSTVQGSSASIAAGEGFQPPALGFENHGWEGGSIMIDVTGH